MIASICELNANEFDAFIDKAKEIVIVEFYADWCVHCRSIAPAFERISEKYKGKAVFAKLNTDQAPNLAMQYGILTIPQFLVFFHGETIGRVNGPDARKLEEVIEKSLQGINP